MTSVAPILKAKCINKALNNVIFIIKIFNCSLFENKVVYPIHFLNQIEIRL